MKKNYALIVIVFLCFYATCFAQYSGTGTFNKITSLAELTDGYYVITNQSDNFLMTNSRSGSDNTGYFFNGASGASASAITNPSTSNVWRIETNGSGRTIYNEDIGKYVGWISSNSASIEDNVIDRTRWNFSYGSSRWTVTNIATPVRQLSYNGAAPRFAAYGNTGQQELQLYRLTAPTNTYIEFEMVSSTITENGTFIDVCVSIFNEDTSPTTVDITLDGSSSAINGTDYDDGGGSAITFPQTLTFPASSSTNQCITIFMSDDIFYEGDETVVLNLTNPTGGNAASLNANTQHVLTILDNETPVIADVVITEIMYNTPGLDDEWIEICNLSGVDQILNDYTVRVNGTIRYTFPSTGTTIASGDCITVAIGEDLSNPLFNPLCDFPPDYSSGLGTNILSNASATITIVADDGSTLVDSVFYDDADGADGNGFSLHFNTSASDNSNTNTNWQEVSDGGSPGIDSLISQCGTAEADINISNNSFTSIPTGSFASTVPYNTVFAATPIGSSTAPKTYYITNDGNIDLNVTSITLDNGSNFSLQNLPTLPLIITPTDPPVAFEVVFSPQSPIGTRNDVVRILNSDPNGENPYIFQIRGDAECAASSIIITPNSGPAGTIVTVTGTNLSAATASFNAIPAALINNISSTVMEVTVPSNALSGSLDVLDDSGCPVSTPFTVIDNQIGTCEGSSSLTELFISEVTDATTGSLTYIELYNPTSTNINLSNYEIRVYSNGSNGTQMPLPADNPAPSVQQLSGTINAGQTFVLTTGTFAPLDNYLCSVPGGDGSYGDQTSNSIAGVNITTDGHDFIGLYQFGSSVSAAPIDAFGVFADNDWMNALGTTITGTRGFNFRRLNTATPLPNATFDETQWNIIDWAGQGDTACLSNNDYGNIGTYDFSTGVPPIITDEPDPVASTCEATASFSVMANQGFAGSLPLAYQWYASAPGAAGWSILSDNAIYSGTTSATLNISNTIGLDNYQYYCQVREDLITCYTASTAVRLETQSTTWISPGIWDNGAPDINTITVLDFDYDTTTFGSFSACSLNIDSGTLNIRNGNYVEIDNDLVINGTLDIETEGSLIMVDNTGTVTNNGTTNVHKTTTDMETFDYTYWSSPVDYSISGTTAQTVLTGFRTDRIFSFNTSLFSDLDADSFDDDQNAWTGHGAFMSSGLGYAAMSSGTGVHQRSVTFSGRLNTGIIPVTVSLSQNAADANDDWNLLGNPYPSAIFVDDFILHNSNLSGTVYLWTHEDDISISNPGPLVYNFNSNDYAMYNSVGGVGTASTGTVVSNTPTGYIASGQGFFVDAITAGTIEFTNDMRDITFNNNNFFRNSEFNSLANEKDRMWLNLTNSDGAFSQILVGYMEDGTLDKDRLYDGIRLNGSNYIDFYSKDDTDLYKYGIQGRPPFTIEDIIPLGYDSNILGELTISLYRAEGILNDVSVYLKDNLLNTINDLTTSDYVFTTENGSFANRFEIIFQSEALSIDDNIISSNQLSIIELQNGQVKFSVGKKDLTIDTIEIIDLLGRTLYNLQGNNSTEIFELHNLNQTAYIAKVLLSNGQTIIKRAVKRN